MLQRMILVSKESSLLKKLNNILKRKFTYTNIGSDSFVNPTSGIYIEKMHELWKKDPKSVHTSWDIYFSNIEGGLDPASSFQSPPVIDKGKLISLQIFFYF